MDKNPMKRHEALRPLSRHHHHGLVIAQRLLQMKETDDPGWVRLMREDLRHFWENGGNDHFREEEEILFPTYSRYADVNRTEIIEALVEHAKIRGLVQFIVNQDDSSIEEMNRLGELLRNHIKKEERMVFPLMESAIPEDVLHQMGSQFSEFKPKDRTSYVRRESESF